MTDGSAWMDVARKELGVQEIGGEKDNPRIVEYHQTTSLHAQDDETPWCSSFANWVLKQAGHEGTMKANARSWLDWGRKCEIRHGAIAVLWRGKPTAETGHVGFVSRWDANFVWLLGGNQGNSVSIMPFPRTRVLAYRWPPED